MSYCRFSSMDWACELYCYESAQGYVTHVASNKPVGEIPKAEHLFRVESLPEFLKAHEAQMQWLETCERADIGKPHDGETFTDATLEDFLLTLQMLKAEGYVFPDDVIETVLEEIAEEAQP